MKGMYCLHGGQKREWLPTEEAGEASRGHELWNLSLAGEPLKGLSCVKFL